jgi:Copper binding proteins, plastocyanin/azurin family
MTRIGLAAATLTGVGALAFAALALAAPTPLAGAVGPGFTITMKKPTKAGSYSLTVNDRSGIHNFHLIGPGVNRKTSVAATGKTTWTLTLKKGTYRFVCDPHVSTMKGSFRIS